MIARHLELAVVTLLIAAPSACLTDPASYARDGSGGAGASGAGAGGGSGGGGSTAGTGGAGGAGGGASGAFEWVVPLRGAGDQTVEALATTIEGTTYAVGAWAGAPDVAVLGPGCTGTRHAFVQKIDPDGTRRWLRCFGTDAIANAVDVSGSGDVAIVGTFSGAIDVDGGGATAAAGGTDVFVVVLDPDGAIVWGQTFGSTKDDVGTGVAVTDAAPIYVAGAFRGTIPLGASSFSAPTMADLFVAKVDAGQVIWADQLHNGSPAPTLVLAARANALGPVVGAGTFENTLDPDGPGGVAAATADARDAFAVGFDASGALTFFHAIGGAGDQRATSIAASTGRFVLGGDFAGTVDFDGAGPLAPLTADDLDAFVVASPFNGTFEGVARVGGAGRQRGRAVGLAPVGGDAYALVGEFSGSTVLDGSTFAAGASAEDAFLATFGADAALGPAGARVIGPGAGSQSLTAVQGVGATFVVAGHFEGSADLDPAIVAQEGVDAFVARLAP